MSAISGARRTLNPTPATKNITIPAKMAVFCQRLRNGFAGALTTDVTGKQASGMATEVRVSGAPEAGLHVSIRNRQPAHAQAGPALPGSGAGLLGLQERVVDATFQ
jgi:hypothetical protein